MLQNQNNFSNKSNSFISQMNSGLATPATSDLELKSSIHSSHYRKILELFIKSSVLDFAIDQILPELGNKNEIHNDNILLFPRTKQQGISLTHPNSPSKFFSHKKKQEKIREQIWTMMDPSKGSGEFKKVRLISPRYKKLPKQNG